MKQIHAGLGNSFKVPVYVLILFLAAIVDIFSSIYNITRDNYRFTVINTAHKWHQVLPYSAS